MFKNLRRAEKMDEEKLYSEKEGKNQNQILIQKSNELIVSKQNTSLTENILVSIGLSRMRLSESGDVVANIYPMELIKIMGLTPGDDNLYTKLKKTAKSITSHPVVVENDKGDFMAFNLIKTAIYEKGVFTIVFHELSKPLITNLTGKFTTMNLLTLSRFKSNYTFRLYEILLKDAYRIPTSPNGYVEVTYNISELRFMISVANVEEERVRKELARYNKADDIDWDRLYELTTVKKEERWGNFKERVIEKARKEMEEKADICFEARYEREGRNYKYVTFRIFFNKPSKPIEDYGAKERLLFAQEGHQYDLDEVNHPKLFEEFLGHNGLTSMDLKELLRQAGQDEERVIRSIRMADEQEEIRNYVGWIVGCIRNNYEKPRHVVEGSAEKAAVYDEIREAVEKTNMDPQFQKSLWEKIKGKADFGDFIASLGMPDGDTLEEVFSPGECVDIYFKYKREKPHAND